MTESAAPALVPSVDEAPAVPPVPEDEELVDYEASPEHTNLEINVVHLSSDYFVVPEEDMAHLQFGPREAVFQKPSDKDNHLKALYMRGHINGKSVTRMLVDDRAILNLMPYSLYKKLGGMDKELIKTNMMVNGVVRVDPVGAKAVASTSDLLASLTMDIHTLKKAKSIYGSFTPVIYTYF